MSGLSIIIICTFIKSCQFASLSRWSDDDVVRTKVPDPWIITTTGQPSPHQPTQPPIQPPPFLHQDLTQGQYDYIKGLLLGLKYSMLTDVNGSPLQEQIPHGSGLNGYACAGYKACPDDRRYYLEFNSVSWIKRPCPYGYAFDDVSCYCTAKLQPAPTTITSPSNTQKTITATRIPEDIQTTQSTMTTSTTETTLAPTTFTTVASTVTTQSPTTREDTTATSPTTTTTMTTAAATTTQTSTDASTTQTPITTTETVTMGMTIPDSQLCSRTVMINSAGFTRFPGSCEIFVHCRFVGDTPSLINTRRCPKGLLWNQDKLTCDYASNVKCVPASSCYNKQAVPDNKGEYLLLTKTGWVVSFCPEGTGFNESTCSCSDKFVPEHLHPQCPDKIPISDDPRGFLEFDGVAWVYVPCPDILVYDHPSCECSFAKADVYPD